VLAVAWRSRLRFSMHTGARVLLVMGFGVALGAPVPAAVAAGVLLILCHLHEPTIATAAATTQTAGVPGFRDARSMLTLTSAVRGNAAALVLLGVLALLGTSAWWALVPAAAWSAYAALAVLRGMAGGGRARHDEARREALAAWGPTFVLHFSGPADSTHQVQMWLPYLQRVNRPFVVIARERHGFDVFRTLGVPVVLASSLASLEACVVPSMRAAFYVNNGMKNTHLVRFANLTHVQLLHGDSDKPPSFNPVTAMYDKVFVAGQAGRDRYAAHGVDIPDSRFSIVGRPQVEAIDDVPAGWRPPASATVLYAPTWRGQFDDSNFCSLEQGPHIVRALVEGGHRVVFRPHPFSASDPPSAARIVEIEAILSADVAAGGREHLFGVAASEPAIVDVFNDVDALVADVSSVVSDFLFSEKPFAVVDTQPGADFTATFPLARAAYVIRVRELATVPDLLATMLSRDPLADARRQMREYYLGPFPKEGYAEAFVAEARRVVDAAPAVIGLTHDQDAEAGEERAGADGLGEASDDA
jgi:hypothetical protein